ncbi:MAG TPA: bifunctional precorrin-2 dehydrogenase/sirohydrochlorin ferrochelatase [Acidimicrobiales bacterium]|nr:bifunctional precorrin-2 dehydrogenase/sirohydrochlorin ferrochelatase [Acidimicrobiales bacterium]
MPVTGEQYPAFLTVAGRRCLVVGAGAVALRRVEGLIAAGARVRVVAPRVLERVRELAEVTVEERPYRRGEVAGHWLVVAATDDPAVNRAVSDDADAAGVWVNRVDDAAAGSFTVPAVVRRGPVTVAVTTGGRSPALATWLRRHVEEALGPEHLTLLELVSERRQAQRADGAGADAGSWQELLDSGMLELIRAGRIAEARERLSTCL